MELLLYIILFFILYYVAKGAIYVYNIYRKIHNATKQFRDFHSSQGGYQQQNTYRSTSSNNSGGSSSSSTTDEVIYDTRTNEQRSRKIFSNDEGEYVDYEEE